MTPWRQMNITVDPKWSRKHVSHGMLVTRLSASVHVPFVQFISIPICLNYIDWSFPHLLSILPLLMIARKAWDRRRLDNNIRICVGRYLLPSSRHVAKPQKNPGSWGPRIQDPGSWRILDLIFTFSRGFLEILDPITATLLGNIVVRSWVLGSADRNDVAGS